MHVIENLLMYMLAKNYHNSPWFDNVIAKYNSAVFLTHIWYCYCCWCCYYYYFCFLDYVRIIPSLADVSRQPLKISMSDAVSTPKVPKRFSAERDVIVVNTVNAEREFITAICLRFYTPSRSDLLSTISHCTQKVTKMPQRTYYETIQRQWYRSLPANYT